MSLRVKDLVGNFYKIYYPLTKSNVTSDKYRAYHYKNVIKILNELNQNSKVDKSLIEKLDISDKMKSKALTFLANTHTNTTTNTTTNKLIDKLTEIKGLGLAKAKKLIDAGLTSMSQLKNKKWQDQLSEETKLYLKYKPENKIPHETIKELEKIITKKINYDFVIVGSYRRKKNYSRDIDIMLIDHYRTGNIYDNSYDHYRTGVPLVNSYDHYRTGVPLDNILNLFLDKLEKLFDIYCYSKGSSKLSTIIKFNNKFYKLDVFKVKPENKIPMLIYTTGSKEFNIKMRAQAKKLGYLLNQNGLFKNKTKINLPTEKSYFDILKIKYLEPENR